MNNFKIFKNTSNPLELTKLNYIYFCCETLLKL